MVCRHIEQPALMSGTGTAPTTAARTSSRDAHNTASQACRYSQELLSPPHIRNTCGTAVHFPELMCCNRDSSAGMHFSRSQMSDVNDSNDSKHPASQHIAPAASENLLDSAYAASGGVCACQEDCESSSAQASLPVYGFSRYR